jgi:hypothetical protein
VWGGVWGWLACALGLLALPGLLPGPLGAGDALARGKAKARPAARATADTPPPMAGGGEGDDSPTDATPPTDAETLDNAAVIKLAHAGLGESTVAAMVRNTKGHYDISTPALVSATSAGVRSGAIAAMIKVARTAEANAVRPDSPDPKAPHPAGVYVLARWLPAARMLAIRPTTTTRTTSGSVLGYAYAGGLIPVSYRAILPQAHAAILAGESRPTFYFYTADSGSQHLATVWGAAPDTAEISLVHFSVTHNGREVKIGSFSIRGANIGVDGKDALPFDIKEAAPGVIAVQPQIDLAPGEYGFVQTAAGVGTGAALASTTSARVFDFAVADGAAISRGELSREGANGPAEQAQGTTTPLIVRIPGAGFHPGSIKQPKPKALPNSSPSLYPK